MRSIFLMKRRGVGGILSRGCLSDQGGHPKRVAQEGCLEEGISVSFKGAEWLNEVIWYLQITLLFLQEEISCQLKGC